MVLSTQRLKARTAPHTNVLPEQRVCSQEQTDSGLQCLWRRREEDREETASIESSQGTPGVVVWSRPFQVRCGTGVATFGRARMGAKVPVDGMMKIQNTVKERGRKKSK